MRFAFIVDPLDRIKTYKDSSFAMMQEAATRGHQIYSIQQEGIVLTGGDVIGYAQLLGLTGDSADWYRAASAQAAPLHSFDAVLMRKDPPFDMEYVYSTYLLELAEAHGALVFNRPRAVRDYNEKLSVAKFPQFTVAMLVSRDESLIRAFLAEHGDVILKPLDAMGGSSIFRVRPDDPNLSVIIETMTQLGRRTIMAQRYIAEIAEGDKRILLIDGKPAPYSLARIPKAGETRGNLAAGGTGMAQPLSQRDRDIAEGIGPTLAENGLLFVGIDVIGDYLTEINVTSPTCMQEIRELSGFNSAAMMIDALEAKVVARIEQGRGAETSARFGEPL
ncbi:MAG: glutathione synthase [Burkholderiales bacterium]|nr:glutathione synthase [Burkholderiales bacterium]